MESGGVPTELAIDLIAMNRYGGRGLVSTSSTSIIQRMCNTILCTQKSNRAAVMRPNRIELT